MAKDDVNRLRAEVRQAHKRATAKASRLRAKGVEISGSTYDPRRNPANIKKYNAIQLRAYQRELNQFTSRRTSFEAGNSGAPLPSAAVERYRRAEQRYNQVAHREYEKVADIPLPGRGLKIRQADMVDRPTNIPRAGGMAVSRPLEPVSRDLSNISDPRALDRLTRQLEGKSKPGYKTRRLREQREELIEMLVTIGNAELIEQAVNLTDDQFNVFWNYNTERVNEISRDYEFMKLKAAGTQEKFMESIHESDSRRIAETLEWASNLPKKIK